ncbi:MAG: hypothetical protein QME41_02075 [Actinomycetota bacterium]|nr:hypothetical protein [Actinomycetota bacterium]
MIYKDFLSNPAPIVSVNGFLITKDMLYQRLEKQHGKQVLQSMLSETLIRQEGNNQHITVGEKEMNGRYKYLVSTYGSAKDLERWLTKQDISRPELYEQLRMQIITEKLLAKKIIQPTEKELIQDYNRLKNTAFEGKSYEEARATIKQSYISMQVGLLLPRLEEELRKKAKITYLDETYSIRNDE